MIYMNFLPHSIRLVRLTITGKELKEVLREILDVSELLSAQKIQGMGFRGNTFRSAYFSWNKFPQRVIFL